jgi:GTP-binding protein
MIFRVNDSPFAGTEGDKVTGRMIRDRLLREAEGNVALRVRRSDGRIPWKLQVGENCSSAS